MVRAGFMNSEHTFKLCISGIYEILQGKKISTEKIRGSQS